MGTTDEAARLAERRPGRQREASREESRAAEVRARRNYLDAHKNPEGPGGNSETYKRNYDLIDWSK
jgi:hypothetical protein